VKAARPVPRSEETPEFIEFWDGVWQQHMNKFDGRGDARKWFLHHVREHGADPRDMIDGARWFIFDGGNQGVGYDGKPVRIHAGSWLNKFAYEDAAVHWRKHQARKAEIEASKSNVVALKQQPKSKFLQEWERREAQS